MDVKKNEYVGEYEFQSSKQLLYPYFSTAAGLSQWFSDDVTVDSNTKVYTFIWGKDKIIDKIVAKMTSKTFDHYVRFEVINKGNKDSDPNYFEFKIESNELTGHVYVKVTDYSEIEEETSQELWQILIDKLKEILGD